MAQFAGTQKDYQEAGLDRKAGWDIDLRGKVKSVLAHNNPRYNGRGSV